MEKEFVTYELALKLKQLGFDEPCLAYWDNDKLFVIDRNSERIQKNSNYKDIFEGIISAPLFSQAFRWFREKYGLYSWIQLHNGYINDSFYSKLPITFSIMDRKTGNKYYERDIQHNYLYKTNEEAELECLKKLIEIVEQKEK
jgi:hypothetical protein